MTSVRRCLGCKATYPPNEPACPKCGSYAGEAEEAKPEPKPKPTRRRKT
jgi:rRNA maturation endonuclease Nob1